jgi:NAD(P)H-dependent FMN reductase
LKRVLFVHHTVSPATHTLFVAALEGARDPQIEGVEVVVRPALTASAADALEADAYLLGSPVNLGYLSGALKHFFDGIYYPCLEATQARPFAVYLHSNSDATGAMRALDSITAGLGWRPAQAPVVVAGEPTAQDRSSVRDMAAALAAGLVL